MRSGDAARRRLPREAEAVTDTSDLTGWVTKRYLHEPISARRAP